MLGRRELIVLLAASGAAAMPVRAALADGDVPGQPCPIAPTRFAATPDNFLSLYAENRAAGRPNLISEAFLVHMLSLSLRRAQRSHERDVLMPLMTEWTAAVIAALSPEDREGMGGQAMAVVSGLLTGTLPANRRAQSDVKLAMAATGLTRSVVMGIDLDFSQCRPRGHYADDPALSRLFRALRYAGIAPFLLNASPATGVTERTALGFAAAALALSRAMRSDAALPLTDKLFAALAAAFGPAEDFSSADLPATAGDATAVRAAWLAQAETRLPSVIDVVMDNRRLGALTPAQAAVSWRILPGRRLADAAALQQLVAPHVGMPNTPQAEAGFATGIIDGNRVRAYVGFDDIKLLYGINADPADPAYGFADMGTAAQRAWAELAQPSLPSDHLRRFVLKTASGANQRRMEVLLGLYAHYRHGLAAVAKQSMTSAPKGMVIGSARAGAVLATDLPFIEALSELARGHAQRFPGAVWSEWQQQLGQLAEVAWRRSLLCSGDADDRRLNNLDTDLAALIDPADDAPLAVDIHTVPSERKVTQIGIGRPVAIIAGGAVGADFALYQWKQPIEARITDAEFAAWLATDAAAAAAWPARGMAPAPAPTQAQVQSMPQVR